MPGEHCVGGTTGHRRCIFVAPESDKPTIGPPSPPPELGPAKGQTWPQQPLEVVSHCSGNKLSKLNKLDDAI
jgi:hypothetical protein